MILERSELMIRPEKANEFARVVMSDMAPLLRQCKGVESVRISRGMEDPTKFIFLVEWSSVDAHHTSQSSNEHRKFRSMFGPYTLSGAMEHFKDL